MSESTPSAPSAPATPAAAQPATPAPAGNTNVVSSPAPATQEPISLSDAGRMLAAKRRQDAAQARVGDAPAQRAATPPVPPTTPTAQPAATPAAPADTPRDSYDTIAKALGLDQSTQPAPDGAAQPAAPIGGSIEIDGRNYSAEQLRAAIGQATDYTRKTQELAVQRQQLQQQAEALAQVLPHIQPELARLGQQLQGAALPDQSLADTNPMEYQRQFAHYLAAMAEQQRLGSLSTLQQQAYERAMAQQVEAGNKVLADKYEFWRDDGLRSTVQRDIAAWAQSKGGYTRAELQGLSDPRHVESMLKAMMFDRMVSDTKTTAPRQPQTARIRGTAPPPAPAAAVHAAEQAFESAPNVRNAAALLNARRAGASTGNGRY